MDDWGRLRLTFGCQWSSRRPPGSNVTIAAAIVVEMGNWWSPGASSGADQTAEWRRGDLHLLSNARQICTRFRFQSALPIVVMYADRSGVTISWFSTNDPVDNILHAADSGHISIRRQTTSVAQLDVELHESSRAVCQWSIFERTGSVPRKKLDTHTPQGQG